MFNLENRRALVTGASGGIGCAIARALHESGAAVALSGRRGDVLKALASELGANTHALTADLGDATAIDRLAKEAEEVLGGIDILVNNAGFTRDNLAMRMNDLDWQSVLDVNLTAAFRLTRALLRGLVRQRWGRVISITSVVGGTGNPGQVNYVASKAGLTGMSKALAHEVAPRGITVNCIAPGFITTPMTAALSETQQEPILGRIPARRFGSPEEVAACAVFLASNEAAYVTGQTLHVNGGMAMI